MKRISEFATLFVFVFLIAGFGLWGLAAPDRESSSAERRKLAQRPPVSAENIFGGGYFTDLEKYLADQFPLREKFRALNTLVRTGPMAQGDVNGLYTEIHGDKAEYLFKSSYPLKAQYVQNFAEVTNQIYDAFIKGKALNYYACVIPDKEYYSNHLKADSEAIAERFTGALEGAEAIEIFDALNLECYYKTDTHWSQDRLLPVMEVLGAAMGFEVRDDYEIKSLSPFYGVYWGQMALNLPGDELRYLTNSTIESAYADHIQKSEFRRVYEVEAFNGNDGYDVFLSGATPLVTVTSPGARTDKELVIFRDSFGSSLAPLFLGEYRKVTLVDLRYLSPQILGEYVDFEGKDVLVLYSALMLNSNIVLN